MPAPEPVELALGKVLYEAGRVMSHVYLPMTAIIFTAVRDEERSVGRGYRRKVGAMQAEVDRFFTCYCAKRRR